MLATAALYANSLGNGFIDFDDPENIVDDYAIRDLGWTNLQHWFSTPCSSCTRRPGAAPAHSSG